VRPLASILQVAALVLLAPLAQGTVQQVKAWLQGRRGPPPWQPYLVLAKLARREAVWPEGSTAVMRLGPLMAFAAVLAAAAVTPLFSSVGAGEILLPLFALALARFALALAALDTGTPFAGMGSSREMTLGAMVEPVLLASLLPWVVAAGTTAWGPMLAVSGSLGPADVVRLAALVGIMLVVLAETGRLPVDNPDTHLELTMIHEAMLLEYAGPPLGVALLGSWTKQLLLVAIVADLVAPWGLGGGTGIVWTLGKWVAILAALGVAESLTGKIRFLRIPGYLGASFAFSLSALMLQIVGVR